MSTTPRRMTRRQAEREFGPGAAMMLWRPEALGQTYRLRARNGQRVRVTVLVDGIDVEPIEAGGNADGVVVTPTGPDPHGGACDICERDSHEVES